MTFEAHEITPRGTGAVSVVRVRGDGALARTRSILARSDLVAGAPKLVRLAIEGEDLDEALVCALSQDEVEIHLHGSPILVRALLAALARASGSPEREHARTIEERARSRLALAPCEAAARILLDQSEGALTRALAAIERAGDHAHQIALLQERARVARHVLEPARVVLAGPVNAGKSTLFNVLAGEARAIVSAEPGTTRDLVVTRAMLGAYPIDLEDSAGERDLDDARHGAGTIERAGQERARSARADADLCLWLAPLDRTERLAVPAGAIELAVFADRVQSPPLGSISALESPAEARRVVAALYRERFRLPENPWQAGAGVPFDAQEIETLARLQGTSGSTSVLPRTS